MIAYGYTALRQFPKSEKFTLAVDVSVVESGDYHE